MLFNSIEFLIFFPLVAIGYFLLPYRWRWLFLLGASYYFYMSWRPGYIILILFTTIINYYTGYKMMKIPDKSGRRKYLILSLISTLGLLFFFKYFNFFSQSLDSLLSKFQVSYSPPLLDMMLPLGISFFTFKALTYTIDTYRGIQKPELHLGKFALFISFFPQLLAGPIERSTRLLPQFNEHHQGDYVRITDGMRLMSWGFFKKLVIADRLAIIVNNIYDNPAQYTGIPLILATYFFAIQIYCDFSGYSDIAIGAAKVLGFDSIQNFRRPYFAESISDFWSRWHISLSTWFRDYLYIPLGGNRVPLPRWLLNLMIVFVVSGLWHGASWTFVIWGGLHGSYMIASILLSRINNKYLSDIKLPKFNPSLIHLLRILVVFNLVAFGWIFFRANSISDAFYIVGNLFTGIQLRSGYGLNLGGPFEIIIIVASILTLALVDFMSERGFTGEFISRKPLLVRWIVYYLLIFSIILLGKLGTTEFIYIKF